MSASKLEQTALSMLKALERSGKAVSRVTLNGRRIEFEFEKGDEPDDFDGIDMRHGKA